MNDTTLNEKSLELILPCETGQLSEKISKVCKYLRAILPSGIYEEYVRKKFSVPSDYYDPRTYSVMELLLAIGSGVPISGRDGTYDPSVARGIKTNVGHKGWDSDQLSGGLMHDNSFNETVVHCSHDQLSRLNYPTYFLDEQTLNMLVKSKLSPSISLIDVPFALPSMLVSLPKGTIKTEGQYLCSISISKTFEWKRNLSGRYELIESVNKILQSKEGSWKEVEQTAYADTERDRAKGEICPCLTIVGVLDGGEAVTVKYPITDDGVINAINKYKHNLHADDLTMERIMTDEGIDENKLKSESMQVEDVAVLGIKLLCFMSARKNEYSLTGNKISDSRYRRGKLMKEALWGANFIGRNYGDALTDKGYGDIDRESRSQRYHWRQGHIRGQWYGKNRSKYKTVVIDPYPVNV